MEVIEQHIGNRRASCACTPATPLPVRAIREQMDQLDALNIPYEYVPGVSSFCALPRHSMPNTPCRTFPRRSSSPAWQAERRCRKRKRLQSWQPISDYGHLFKHRSAGGLAAALMEGGYPADTPAAIVYKASWPDEKTFRCTVSTLAQTAKENNITKTALILVGRFLDSSYERSKLYDPSFETEFRKATR